MRDDDTNALPPGKRSHQGKKTPEAQKEREEMNVKRKKALTMKIVGYIDQEANKMTLKTRGRGDLRYAPEGLLRIAADMSVTNVKKEELEEIHKSLHEKLEDAWRQAVEGKSS